MCWYCSWGWVLDTFYSAASENNTQTWRLCKYYKVAKRKSCKCINAAKTRLLSCLSCSCPTFNHAKCFSQWGKTWNCPHFNCGANTREGHELGRAASNVVCGVAATEGQCCSSAGATRWNVELRSSGSSMSVPHVITICSACIHSSVNKLTDNISIVSADCQHASAHVRSSPAILILSRISPVTSDCKAAEASWQLSLQIQTVLLWHSVSPWTRSLFEAEIRRHLIRDKSRYILKKGNRNVHKTNAVITGEHFHGTPQKFVGTFISVYPRSALSLWLLSFTGSYIMRISLKVKLFRFSGFPGNTQSLSPGLKERLNKPGAAIAILMLLSLMALHGSLVVPRCHWHVSDSQCRR